MKRTVVIGAAVVAALVVGFVWGGGAIRRASYSGPFRARWQKPEQVLHTLDIRPGQRVADLGAGGGYFTFRLADAVGPTGKVYAIDIDEDMTDWVAAEAERRGYANVETILAEPADPHLPADGVDLIFTCDTYHHLEDRTAYFARLKPFLRPGGRVAVIDYNDNSFLPWLVGHVSPSNVVRVELGAAGYRIEQEYDFLPKQTFIVFAKE
jgi:arsenite methyltransferase